MRKLSLSLIALVICFARSVAAQQPAVADEPLKPVTGKTDLYPAGADAKQQIEASLKTARKL